MESIKEVMCNLIEKCDICIDNEPISNELLMRTLVEFFSSTIEKDEHNASFILHTGSVCFDAILLTCAAVSNLFYNESDPTAIVESLSEGDTVLYYIKSKSGIKAQRCSFVGVIDCFDEKFKDSGPYVLIRQWDKMNNESTNYLPKTSWNKIVPYYGDATALDGRGIRKQSGIRNEFLKEVLGMSDMQITMNTDSSTVVVMPRDHANYLLPALSFKFGKHKLPLLELVTVSYYTEGNNVYQYGKNAAKAEPVIKLTSKVAVARKLLRKKEQRRPLGLVVMGNEILKKSETELPELINRKSIQYVYICSNIDSEYAQRYVQSTEEPKPNMFACTKEFLLSNSLPVVKQNDFTKQLSEQVDAIVENDVATIMVDAYMDWEQYRQFKRDMHVIRSSEFVSDRKEEFIIQSITLFNLFITAAFPIAELDEAIRDGEIDRVVTTEARIRIIRTCVESFPRYLKENATRIIEYIEKMYSILQLDCPKMDALNRLIKETHKKRIAIVVPKAYYSVLLSRRINNNKVTVVTANRFNNKDLFDAIIVLGNISGSRFDPLRCKSSRDIYVLLYELEKYQFKSKAKKMKEVEKMYNHLSTIEMIVEDDDYDSADLNEAEIEEINSIDDEINTFIETSFTNAAKAYFGQGSNKHILSEVVCIAIFDNGEIAFLSKNYIAYVLDEEKPVVSEVSVEELNEGDIIIFTRSNERTRDVVDELLGKIVEEQRVTEAIIEAYMKSKKWKQSLIEYMNENDVTAKEIADTMIRNGVSVQEATIRGWLDEDSHTVGPRKLDSIQQVALVTGDEYMFDHADEYFDACAVIRRTRRQILSAIGQAILGRLTGNENKTDSIFESVSDNIEKLATIIQIEKLTRVNESIPVNLINRPIDMED